MPEVPGLSFCDRFIWERLVAGVRLSASTRAVALTLAQYASPDGGDVRPGNARLSAASGVAARTVERSLSQLRDSHLLLQTRRGTNVGGREAARVLSSVHRLCGPTALVEVIARGEDVDDDGRGRAMDFAAFDPASLLSPCACHPSNLAASSDDLPVPGGGEVDDLPVISDDLPVNGDDLPVISDDLPVSIGDLTTTPTTTAEHPSSPTKQVPAAPTRALTATHPDPWDAPRTHDAGLGLGLIDEDAARESSGSAADWEPEARRQLEAKGYDRPLIKAQKVNDARRTSDPLQFIHDLPDNFAETPF